MSRVRRFPLLRLRFRRPFRWRSKKKVFWDAIRRSTKADWIYQDGLMILRSDPTIRVRLELGGEDCRAPWVQPWRHHEPYHFAYTFSWRNKRMARLRMVQLTPAIELPLPHQENNRQLYLREVERHWAYLKSVDADEVDRALQRARIEVV